MIQLLRACVRAILVLVLLLAAPLLVGFNRVCPVRGAWTCRSIQFWYACLVAAMGVRVKVVGTRPRESVLYIANHISWVDIPVIGSKLPTVFVAKLEVRDWPFVGLLARSQNTLFLDRGRGATPGFAAMMASRMRAGRSVVLFPEGTTTDGSDVGVFYSRLYQSALDAGVSVQPITLNYSGVEARHRIPYINDDTLFESLWRIIRGPGLQVEIVMGETVAVPYIEPQLSPQIVRGRRDALAEQSQRIVRQNLVPLYSMAEECNDLVSTLGRTTERLDSWG